MRPSVFRSHVLINHMVIESKGKSSKPKKKVKMLRLDWPRRPMPSFALATLGYASLAGRRGSAVPAPLVPLVIFLILPKILALHRQYMPRLSASYIPRVFIEYNLTLIIEKSTLSCRSLGVELGPCNLKWQRSWNENGTVSFSSESDERPRRGRMRPRKPLAHTRIKRASLGKVLLGHVLLPHQLYMPNWIQGSMQTSLIAP